MGIQRHPVTIADTETTSPAINIAGQLVVGLRVGTVAAATCTFTASDAPPQSPKGGSFDAQTFLTVCNDAGTTISVTTPDNRHIVLDPATFAGMHQLKIVAASAASGAEVWTLVTRTAS